MRIKYGDFEFPSNPNNIEISSSAVINTQSLLSASFYAENIALKATIVKGNGSFYGKKADEYCAVLQMMLKQRNARWLYLPSMPPIYAYLNEFSFSRNAANGGYDYTFEFTEKGNTDKKDFCKESEIINIDGMNAFELANMYGVNVDEIMRLNDFKTPFDITNKDTVRIYED